VGYFSSLLLVVHAPEADEILAGLGTQCFVDARTWQRFSGGIVVVCGTWLAKRKGMGVETKPSYFRQACMAGSVGLEMGGSADADAQGTL
jgi:hypothetical protein